jgi:hypothetical protein
MSEKFRINRTFRNSTTIYGYIWAVFPRTELMNYLRETPPFPVPLSPVINTERSVGATLKATSIALFNPGSITNDPKSLLIA